MGDPGKVAQGMEGMGASGEWGLSNKLARIIMIVTSEIVTGCGFLGELGTGFTGSLGVLCKSYFGITNIYLCNAINVEE